MMEELINHTKKLMDSIPDDDENEINTSSNLNQTHNQNQNNQNNQNSHKNKKGKNKNKNKNKDYKDKENEKEEKLRNKNKEKEEKEGNKKVDDFIKSIKEKKEKKEKEMQQENLKLLFFTKYKYLFAFDPSNRLKLRDENNVVDEDIIKDLFVIISTKFVDNKEVVKEFLILIDSIAEILYSTPKNKENEQNIELFLMSCIKLINQYLSNNSEDNKFTLIINVFYSMMKLKLELQNKYPNVFNKIYGEISKEIITDSLNKNINNNDKYDIKDNSDLVNDLICFFFIEFFNNNNKLRNTNLTKITELIKHYSILLNTKKKGTKK
jgi:hypothetical protein